MKGFSATSLRNLLITLLILAILLAGAGFYFAFSWIKTFAGEVNQAVATAHASAVPSKSASGEAVQTILAQQATLNTTLSNFYVTSTDFPAKPIQDINTYASKSGLAIGDVTLGGTTGTPGASGGSSLNVKLKAPVSYSSLLKFTSYIQNSLPKMHITTLSLKHDTGGKADSVLIDSLTVSVETH